MAWIELHQNLPAHRKVKKLKRLLKIKTPQAVGHLAMLWLWAVDNTPDGDLSMLDPEDIAEACEWPKDAQVFVDALVEAGFVDADAGLHDWGTYTGMLMKQRERNKEQNKKRQQRYRDRNKAENEQPVTRDNHERVTRYDSVSNAQITPLPNQTRPNQTKPSDNDKEEEDRKVLPTAERAADAPSRPPRQKSESVAYYFQNINATPSARSLAELETFEAELGTAVCTRAMEIALDNRAPRWDYIRAILRKWSERGVKCLADVQALDENHRQQAGVGRPQKVAKAPTPAQEPVSHAKKEQEILENERWMREYLSGSRGEAESNADEVRKPEGADTRRLL